MIVDISACEPSSSDHLLVDANVWMIYTAPGEMRGQAQYNGFIKRARKRGAKLSVSSLTLLEMAHAFEARERRLTEEDVKSAINLKDFRSRFPDRRLQAVGAFDFALVQVQAVAQVLPVTTDYPALTSVLQRLRAHPLDGYDAMLLAVADKCGISKILTDDSDFIGIDGVEIYTANRRMIQDATILNPSRALSANGAPGPVASSRAGG